MMSFWYLANFEQIAHIVLAFPLLTLNDWLHRNILTIPYSSINYTRRFVENSL